MHRSRRGPGVVIAFVVMLAWGDVRSWGQAADPAEIDPTGGLRSRAVVPQPPAIGISREELVRQWDLDGNGTIDASEAGVARARMRRARMEMEVGSGIDPLTGKPRVAADVMPEESPEDPAAAADDLPVESRPPRAADEHAPPGTRVPVMGSVVTGTAGPKVPSTSPGPSAGKGAAGRPAAGSRSGSLTGGIRAGAPAARGGYGSLPPKPDLNAGLPRASVGRPVLSGTRGPTRGGFMPSPRSPAPPRLAPVTPAPTAPSRVMADEIGGY